MSAVIRFDSVSKQYRLRRDRPRSFREAFSRLFRRPAHINGDRDWLWALKDASFEIQPGETVGLIGSNGAGKSTTLKLISRVAQPTSGRIDVNGRVGALLELGAGFHPELSGRDNVYLSGALIGMGRQEMRRKFDAIVAFSELEAFIDQPVKHYSSGMYARLGFAVSIHLDPDILLVDEVLAVGDQNFQRKCVMRIAEMQKNGVTICFVSHSLDLVRTVCQRAIWFEHGRLMADGAAESVAQHYLDHMSKIEAHTLGLARASGPASHQRWGNRQIEIRRVWFTNAEGKEQVIFKTGDQLKVHVEYYAPQPVVDPVFGMAVHRSDGLHVSGPNTAFAGLHFPAVHGAGQVTYAIPCLPLLEGRFAVSISTHHRNGLEMYDFHDQAYLFQVTNSDPAIQERYGLMTLQGQWSHQPFST